jgi:hypothetical protein
MMWRRCHSNKGVVSAHLPYAVSQSQVGLAIVKPIDSYQGFIYAVFGLGASHMGL